MSKKVKPLGFYNYTVILTYIGMLFGFCGIINAFEDNTYMAVVCLMFAGLCDMFDGAIASTMERTTQEKCFGIQIDSLSDLICFGVLPGVIIYSVNRGNIIALIVSCFYVLCALIRLAYFNVDEQERQQKSSGSREIYFGLPVTTSALFIPAVYSLDIIYDMNVDLHLICIIAVMGILFLTPFQMKKPKIKGKIAVILCGLVEFGLVLFIRGVVR